MNMDHTIVWPQPSAIPSTQSEQASSAPRLVLFVYGTLKTSQANHGRFCAQATQIQPATTLGRLYALPAGYPALEVPEHHIFAHGTTDPRADATTQTRIAAMPGWDRVMPHPSGDWTLVHGEMITFTHPRCDLPPIDRLEGFDPGRRSYYQRVLIPVWSGGQNYCAWTYTMPVRSRLMPLPGGVWPPLSLLK